MSLKETIFSMMLEALELGEAVEVRHDRYMRSHGKKARDSGGGSSSWMFTHKPMGDVDVKNKEEVHTAQGKFADAKKSAQQWGKQHGHSAVYVMEEVDLDEGKWDYPDKIKGSEPRAYWDQGNKIKKAERKTHRKEIKAKAHADLMKGKTSPTKEEVDVNEGMKEKISGVIRREKQKEYPLLQNRRDVAATKAGSSYAAGDHKKGDRYMKWRDDNMKKEEVELDEEGHGVFLKGGSVGEKRSGKPVEVHSNIDDAKAQAKRLNKLLSPGEKQHYGLKYHVKPVTEGFVVELDEISKKTLGSYIKKAASDIGYAAAADDTNKELKRHKGIAKATNKLTKEEVELDEAEKPTYHYYATKNGIDAKEMKLTHAKSKPFTSETDALKHIVKTGGRQDGIIHTVNSATGKIVQHRGIDGGQKAYPTPASDMSSDAPKHVRDLKEEVNQIDEISDEKKKEYIRAVADKGGILRKPRPGSLKGFDRKKDDALVKAFKGGSMQDYANLHKKSEKRAGIALKALNSLKKEEVELDENIGGLFKNASEWENSAKDRGLVVKSATHPSGEMTKYQIAKDKQGNNRGHFDHGTKSGRLKEEVELDELSQDTLNNYHSKAGADRLKAKATVQKTMDMKKPAASTVDKATSAFSRFQKRGKGMTAAANKMSEENNLDEVSDQKLDTYRQKAFADQPAGDDGSDKYRKRKFGRDLAFAKQTGRAKVLATKEEVELDELAIIKNNRKFSNVKRFDTDKETNAFLEKNPDHGVLHTDDGGTYVAKNKNKGATVKALNGLKKEEVDLEESWSKGASSANRSDAVAAAKHQAEADRLRKAANKLGKDNPQHNELMGDHHKAMAKSVKHSFHSGKYPSMAIAKKDYNSHMDQAKEYNAAVTENYELDEAKTDIYHKHMLKALGKTRLPKDHGYTSTVSNNGDFVVRDGGGRVAGRIAKGEHDLK